MLSAQSAQACRRATREDFKTIWSGWKSRHPRSPSVWAEQERYFSAGQSPLTSGENIRYNHAVMPHAREPMDAVDEPGVNVIVLWMGRRMGKTEAICGNIIGRTVTDDPGNIFDMWPVEDSADRYSRDVIEPMIEATPALRDLFVLRKSRDSGRTIDYKRFTGGSLYIVNAGSKSKTRGMAAKVVLLHEIDAYPVSAGGEGDPIEKALGRSEGFAEAIKILESTGTLTAIEENGKKIHRSNIEKWFERSDQRKWFCPCRACGAAHWLKWEQIQRMEKKGRAAFFYVCEDCAADHNEAQWRAMVAGGEWRATAPFINGIRGYWINGFNSLLPRGKGFTSKLQQFYVEGNRALAGTAEERRVWINEVKTELCSDFLTDEQPPDWQPIFERREDYTLPKGALFLSVGADCQLNRIELVWRAWGREEESWGIDHVVLEGHIRHQEVWAALRRELARKWTREDGAPMTLGMAFVDGGAYPEDVYRFFQQLAISPVEGVSGKARAAKGMGVNGHPIVSRKMMTVAKNLKGHHVGTWEAKDRIYERLRIGLTGETPQGRMHYNKKFTEEFFQQLTAESVVTEYDRGIEIRRYENPERKRNEALDMEVYALAAWRLFPRNLDILEEQLLESAALAKKPKDEAPASPETPAPSRTPSGFIGVGGRRGGWL